MTQWVDDALEAVDPVTSPVWVALREADVVGFLCAGTRPHWSGQVDAYVGELVVAERAEGHGVGHLLMARAEQWAQEAGHDRLTLETGAANTGALAFYAALGYATEEVVLTRAL